MPPLSVAPSTLSSLQKLLLGRGANLLKARALPPSTPWHAGEGGARRTGNSNSETPGSYPVVLVRHNCRPGNSNSESPGPLPCLLSNSKLVRHIDNHAATLRDTLGAPPRSRPSQGLRMILVSAVAFPVARSFKPAPGTAAPTPRRERSLGLTGGNCTSLQRSLRPQAP